MSLERIKVEFKGVFAHPKHGAPLVFVGDAAEAHVLSIVVGFLEAQAILLAQYPNSLPRPMTHDLLKTLLEAVGTSVEEVEVADLVENTYYGLITLKDASGNRRQCDIRPSDAIAIALRTGSPIFVQRHVFEKAGNGDGEAKTLLNFLRLEAEDEAKKGKEKGT